MRITLTFAASIPSRTLSMKICGPSGLLTPPEMMIPRPACLDILKVYREGERGEMGGETLDSPSGEILLLCI